MKKYKKYGHHKKKKWPSTTLQFILDFVIKNKNKSEYGTIYLPTGGYGESLTVYNSVNLSSQEVEIENMEHYNKWPPIITLEKE